MKKQKSRIGADERPASYWEHSDPLQAILAGISGTARRRMITDFWKAGRLDQLEDELLREDVNFGVRLGGFHPFFMGGEFLPQRLPGEVAIVRIDLESVTFDVIQLRARPLPDGRIGLRWVNEYECEFEPPCDSIDQPFSFAELTAFIEGTDLDAEYRLPVVYTASNCGLSAGNRAQIEGMRGFTTFSSDFYPMLGEWAAKKINAWLDAFIAETCGDEQAQLEPEGEQ